MSGAATHLFDFIDQSVIVKRDAPAVLKSFAAHAQHQVARFQMREVGLQEAVDGLRFKAARHGLIASYGQHEVEWIIGYACAEAGVHYGDIRPLEGVYP